uniref:Major facilitator superfamily (MFS) profile domain-containing protein n=1 Tax=Arion vulgaris TaxID=1028688 RepID=A0A0B7AY25_9EUPU
MCMVRTYSVQQNQTLVNNYTIHNVTTRSFCDDSADDLQSVTLSNKRAEFSWDKLTRSELLSMYFYGYIFTQIPSGWLASRYGGRRVWGTCMLISAICAIITPISARTHVYLAYAVRFILGLAAGVTFPSMHALLGQWSPPYERSRMASISFAGNLLGNVVTFSISGVLCEYGFDNGWGSIFYLSGIFNCAWVVAWFLLTADTPAKHRRISPEEKEYIETAIGKAVLKKVRKVPWLQMFTSGPLWAAISGHFCNNYVNYTLLTSLPIFMKESLRFDIKQNGALSALPFVFELIGSLTVGYAADSLIEKGIMSTKNVRKTFQCASFLGIAICIAIAGQMNCELRQVAIAMLCLSSICTSFNRAGYLVNHLDLAPSYAGILFGITNTAATIPGMIAPMVAGALTPNGTADEWRIVFYVCSGVAATGSLLFFILAEGTLQPWNS